MRKKNKKKRMEEKNCKEDLFCGVNEVKNKNPDDMDDLEKKHTPVIKITGMPKAGEAFDVSIKVGEYMAHPNDHAHFIQWLELYSGHTFLGRVDFSSERTDPVAKFRVKLEHLHPLIAIGHCNIHGSWKGEIELE